jgi:peptidoglycan biosynthesis protein MviN/MurJ (putative lipid II flippase)
VPACYALGNTRVPVISSAVAVGATITLNLAMVRPFGYWGLALGTSFAAILNSIFLLVSLRRMLREAGGELPFRPLVEAFAKHLCVALLMGLVCYYTHRGLNWLLPDRILAESIGKAGLVLSRVFKILVVLPLGAALIVLFGRWMGLAETTEAFDLFTKKVKNKLYRARS